MATEKGYILLFTTQYLKVLMADICQSEHQSQAIQSSTTLSLHVIHLSILADLSVLSGVLLGDLSLFKGI